jgi:hypothetical protein
MRAISNPKNTAGKLNNASISKLLEQYSFDLQSSIDTVGLELAVNEFLQPTEQAMNFWLRRLLVLELNQSQGVLLLRDYEDLLRAVTKDLRAVPNYATASVCAELAGRLALVQVHIAFERGELERGLWLLEMVRRAGKPQVRPDLVAGYYLRAGRCQQAIEWTRSLTSPEAVRVQMEALRCKGALTDAKLAAEKLGGAADDVQEQWLLTSLQIQQSCVLTQAAPFHRRHSKLKSLNSAIETYLWTMILPAEVMPIHVPKADALAITYAKESRFDSDLRLQLRLMRLLEKTQDKGVSVDQRLSAMGDLLRYSRRLSSLFKRLLFWLACIKILHRTQQRDFASIFIDSYRNASLQASQGETADSLQLICFTACSRRNETLG